MWFWFTNHQPSHFECLGIMSCCKKTCSLFWCPPIISHLTFLFPFLSASSHCYKQFLTLSFPLPSLDRLQALFRPIESLFFSLVSWMCSKHLFPYMYLYIYLFMFCSTTYPFHDLVGRRFSSFILRIKSVTILTDINKVSQGTRFVYQVAYTVKLPSHCIIE